MKIKADQLFALGRLHSLLLSRTSGNLLDVIAASIRSNPFEVKRLLSQLEKLKIIRDLVFAGNAFTFEFNKKDPLTANMLVEDLDFYLISPDLELEPSDPKKELIKTLQEQVEALNKRVKELERDLDCVAKHGKPHDKIVEGAIVDHGD
jgi:hypothetical protein